ncbi:MAG: hypothetical protein ABW123_12135 [Cystobacter sp.]
MTPTRSSSPALALTFFLASLTWGWTPVEAAPGQREVHGDEPPVVVEVEEGTPSCDGFWSNPCVKGLTCVDDPRDTCDHQNGGSDCPGLCVQAATSRPPPVCDGQESEHRYYVSREPALCAVVLFSCAPGSEPFFDECGCGCEQRR